MTILRCSLLSFANGRVESVVHSSSLLNELTRIIKMATDHQASGSQKQNRIGVYSRSDAYTPAIDDLKALMMVSEPQNRYHDRRQPIRRLPMQSPCA